MNDQEPPLQTQRLRRRRSRRKARRKQILIVVAVAAVAALGVWTRILIERQNDAMMFAAATATAPASFPTGASKGKANGAAPVSRNVILFVGTGYGVVPSTATRIYAVGEDGALAVDRLPETALVRTHSRNAQTADGAAAMTAYMTGVKVDNEVLSESAETRPYDEAGRPQSAHGETTCPSAGNGKPQTTLLELAKASGRGTGIVTTARVTQPVTAATYAHLCQRDGENAIAGQLVPGGPGTNARLGDGVDVIFGGGRERFVPKDDPRGSARNDGRDLLAELRAKGYAVIGRVSELVATPQTERKIVGLFARGPLAYDADRTSSSEPSLADMTGRAIDLLAHGNDGHGYFLVVEAGRIGDALDASLARTALQEGRAFDDAIGVALDRVRELDPEMRDTTIVVTADHDHTLIINGNAATTGRSSEVAPGILGALRSHDDPTQSALDSTGRPYTTLVFGGGARRTKGSRALAPPLSDLALREKNVRYEAAIELDASTGGADVPLAATGVNASHFHGTIDNTRVFTLLREAMGL